MTFVPDDCYPWVSGGCKWTIAYLWRGWDWFARASVCLLALLALNALTITCQRLYIYLSAKRQTRNFLRDATAALRDGRFDDVVAIAARTPRSPTAVTVTEGIHAFAQAPPQFSEREAIHAAERACRRVRGAVTAELARGLETLRTVALVAPFVSLGGTCFGVLFSFRALEGERSTVMSYTALSIAQSLVMTALGLVVGILAVWAHNSLRRRVEVFESEMLQAEAEILLVLKAHPHWRYGRDHTAGSSGWTFLTGEVLHWEVSYDRQLPLLVEVWGSGILLALVLFLHSR
jgi:biopolymer transport protein ExbB/TolQ